MRNRFMVDNSDYVLTWFDGAAGGTKSTILYALKKDKRVINLKNLNDESQYESDVIYSVLEDDEEEIF